MHHHLPRHSAPGRLARFQNAFAGALFDPESAPPEAAALIEQPGFAVYRNTVMKSCIDAMQANYATVTRLVGEEWFRAAAAVYVRERPPTNPSLLDYGNGFADFLAGFGPAGELPYLPGVARLDRYWIECHAATDCKLLEPAAISALAPDKLARTVLRPHPAARWAWFNEGPVFTIWACNRSSQAIRADLDWKAEGVLLTRPDGTVQWTGLAASGCAFLDACAAGRTVARAAQAALEAQPDTNLAQLMAVLIGAGALRPMHPDDQRPFSEENP